MRITNQMLVRTALADVQAQRARLAETQEQASSGRRILRPSDDPVGASAAFLLRAGIDATEQFERNLTQAQNRVLVLEAALGHATEILIEAKEVALQGGSETQDAVGRDILAQRVEALHARLLAEANTQSSGTHVFAGMRTDAPPFVASGPFVAGAPAPTVSYVGDGNEVTTPIDEGIEVATTGNGGRVFLGDADGDGLTDAGAEDLFDILASLRDALAADDPAATRAVISRIDVAADQIAVERTRVGMIDTQVAEWQTRLAERKIDLEIRLSDTQDADLAEVFSELIQQETALQAALDSTTRLIQPSLLDFLG